MSTIHEALKKAGHQTGEIRASQAVDLKKSELLPDPLKKNPRVNWSPIFVLLVLILITGPLIAPIFSTPFRMNAFQEYSALPARPSKEAMTPAEPTSALTQTTAEQNRKGQFATEELPLAPVINPAMMPNLSLNGIVFSADDSYCLINGKVIKPGQSVDNAELLRISPHGVTLNYLGRKIELPMES